MNGVGSDDPTSVRDAVDRAVDTALGPPLLLTVEQTAHKLGISRARAYELIANGELKSVKLGRCRRILASTLESFASQLEAEQNACRMRASTRSGAPKGADITATSSTVGKRGCDEA